ncbi:MAG: FKBP-type peptidyl-prolyl cis-trans isomerase [Prevotellaceae bacterium]|nr:FKBP-type peptidyl-prolyl cis-trans isomerase [Candidatus Minthosoma caballi]
MKKFSILAAAVAMTAMTMVSCDGNGSSNLKSGEDSLAYNFGVAQSEGLKQYMTMQLGVDTAYIDEFIKGMKEGAVNEADPKKEAYMQGMQVGKQIQQMSKGLSEQVFAGDSTQTLNINIILNGFVAGLKGNAGISSEEAATKFQEALDPIRKANTEKQYGDNKAAGEKYLAENAKKEGVKTTASGLQYKVIKEGTGALPTDTTKVQVNYEGKLIDGTVFDSSYQRNMPFTVDLAMPRVIQGWVEALKMMPAGSTWEVTIPQELGYGDQDMGQIKPYSTLIFTIEVLK